MDSKNVTQGSTNSMGAGGQSSSFRYFITMIFLGISMTTAASSFIAPRVILWWYDSPAPTPITAACVPAIDWAIRMFQWTQVVSLVLGAVFGLLMAIRFRKKPQLNPLSPR